MRRNFASYIIDLSEDDVLYVGEVSAKNIPYTRARQRMGAEMSGRRRACIDNRRPSQRIYQVGDKVAFEARVNFGTKSNPVMYGIVAIGKINAYTDGGYIISGMKDIPRSDILGRLRD